MKVFKYKALNSDKKVVSGLVEADSDSAAASLLTDKGLSIISLEEQAEKKGFNVTLLDKISIKDIVIFTRQFSVMISANVALVQAFKILINQIDNPRLKIIVSELADEVDGGARLSDALAKRPKVFSNFYVSVVRSGETSGKLDEVLEYLADEMERDYDMNSKIKGAMLYPAFIICGLSVVGVLMIVFVVPKLTGIIEESGGELPLATRILIGTSDFMRAYWWLILIALGGFLAGFRSFIKIPKGRELFDLFKLKLPIFGKLLQRIYLVRFTRSMNTLIKGGVGITQGLEISADIIGNQIYRQLILKTIKEVEDGNSISNIFAESPVIPHMVAQMMAVGEKTGKLDMVLEKITDFYSREINNIVANLMTLMEPIIMVIIGVAVGVMVAAVLLPMYNMANSF